MGTWYSRTGGSGADSTEYIIREAHAAGINFFDTADLYECGEAEVLLGRAIRHLPRDSVVIGTKVGGVASTKANGAGLSRKHLLDSIHSSLRRMRLDYIDVYQLHTVDSVTPFEETLSTLCDFVRRGLVAYVGVCNYSLEQLLFAMEVVRSNGWEPITSYQLRLNMLDWVRSRPVLDFCRSREIGVIAYSPLAEGVLSGKYSGLVVPEGSRGAVAPRFAPTWLNRQNAIFADALAPIANELGVSRSQLALAWCRTQSGVATVLMGLSSLAQLFENLGAADLELTEHHMQKISDLVGALDHTN